MAALDCLGLEKLVSVGGESGLAWDCGTPLPAELYTYTLQQRPNGP